MAWYRAGDRWGHAFTSTGPGRARTCTHAVPLVCRSFDTSIPGSASMCRRAGRADDTRARMPHRRCRRLPTCTGKPWRWCGGGQRLRRELLARRWALEDARADLAIVAREGARVRGALLRARQHEVGTHATARARTPRASEREREGALTSGTWHRPHRRRRCWSGRSSSRTSSSLSTSAPSSCGWAS
eukprot:COSAG01_NODE_699_length_14176_cov_21.100590_6_plen_187_part_00